MIPACRDRKVNVESRVYRASRESAARKVRQALRVQPVHRGQRATLVKRDRKAPKGILVRPGRKVLPTHSPQRTRPRL